MNNQDGQRRILVIDDQQSIHDDFNKVLQAETGADEPNAARAGFFGAAEVVESRGSFDLCHALQGQEGIDLHRAALNEEQPFAVAFVDVRMPPGLDGIQTIRELWAADDDLQTVICTAYSDYSFEDIVEALGQSDRLLILKKPFDPMEVRQLAEALSAKWLSLRAQREQLQRLEATNIELRKAEKAAREASRAKSDFLTNMSHEIRTPLSAMLGYVDFACDDGITNEERQKYERTIRESGAHLLRILDDVLDLARVEAKQTTINTQMVSPFDIASEVGRMFLPLAANKDLVLSLHVSGPVPERVSTDPARLRQILIQLVGNAIKCVDDGSIGIELTSTPEVLSINVTDTGPGIPVEEQESLFEMFHQRDNSLTRKQGGLGIGLALGRRLAQLLGGTLTVSSMPGQGSTFTLSLPTGGEPLIEITGDSRLEPTSQAPAARPELSRLDGRILVVEDVMLNRVLLSKILRKAGAVVVCAEDGLQGVEAVRASSDEGRAFDLVLMDMQMPVMDGYEATRTLRAEGETMPIVALTAHAMKGDRERCLEAGCDDYATKPIDRNGLVQLCCTLIDSAARSAA
ncbi:MAG: response regulator [Planctomycetota bacterium]